MELGDLRLGGRTAMEIEDADKDNDSCGGGGRNVWRDFGRAGGRQRRWRQGRGVGPLWIPHWPPWTAVGWPDVLERQAFVDLRLRTEGAVESKLDLFVRLRAEIAVESKLDL